MGYTVNDRLRLETGVGYVRSEWDMKDISRLPFKHKLEATSCYLQAQITLAPGVTFTPEIGVVEGLSIGVQWGDHTETQRQEYFGAKWQIEF